MADGGYVLIKAKLDTSDISSGVSRIEGDLKGINSSGLDDVNAAAREAGTGLDKAAQEADNLSGSLGGLGGGLGEVKQGIMDAAGSFGSFGDAIPVMMNPAALGITAAVSATIGIGVAASNVATDYQNAAGQIQAALGVSAQEAERLRDVAASIYEDGFGESLSTVTETLTRVSGHLKNLSDNDLAYVTQSAQLMADKFDVDVGESVRGISGLMNGFGITATEATDLLAAGIQNGLNYSDELADNIAEYSGRWGEAGVSASEYFSLLQAGADNGAYNLDKVGDFLNEFMTSLSDGRMDEAIGKLSTGTQQVFENFKNGKADAKDVLDAVIGDMQTMTSETDRAAFASQLWSSLGEDNAMGMITALGGVQDSCGEVGGAAQEMAEATSQSIDSKATSALRNLQSMLLPVGEAINGAIGYILDAFNGLFGDGGPLAQASGAFDQVIQAAQPFLDYIGGNLSSTVESVSKIFGSMQDALKGLQPLFQIVAGVVGGMFLTALSLASDALAKAAEVIAFLWDAVAGVANVIGGFVNLLIGLFTGNTEMINEAVNQMFGGLIGIVTGILNAILSIFGLDLDTVVSFFTNAFSNIQTFAGDFLTNVVAFFAQLPGNIMSFLTMVITNIAAFVLNIGTQAIQAGSQFLGNIVNFFIQLPGQIASFLASVISGVIGFVGNMASNAMQAGSQFLANIVNFFIQLPGNIASLLATVISNVIGFAAQMGANALNAGRQFLDNIVNTLMSIPGKVVSIGGDIITGLINGITGSIGKIGETLLGGIGSAIDSVKNFLGIASPSRLFRDEIGAMMSQGIAVGFEQDGSLSGVVDTVADMTATVSHSVSAIDWYAQGGTWGSIPSYDSGSVSFAPDSRSHTNDIDMSDVINLLSAILSVLKGEQTIVLDDKVVARTLRKVYPVG